MINKTLVKTNYFLYTNTIINNKSNKGRQVIKNVRNGVTNDSVFKVLDSIGAIIDCVEYETHSEEEYVFTKS